MGVSLREKKLENGMVSYYLDIYHKKVRWYEFLEIHVNKAKPTPEDKQNKREAIKIRAKRENELLNQVHGTKPEPTPNANFMQWYEQFAIDHSSYPHHKFNHKHLVKFLGKGLVTFADITPAKLRKYSAYLLSVVSHNSARQYFKCLYAALYYAVKDGIITESPFDGLDRKKDFIREQDIFRKAYTLEELQQLVNTPFSIPEQYKQGYLFSCFCGLRWSDTHPLRWEQIQVKQIDGVEHWFIYFQQEKTENIEYTLLSEQAVEILKERQEQRKAEPLSPYVFPEMFETSPKTKKVYNRVRRAIKKWALAAGLNPKEMKFHTARHSFATNILEHSPDADLWTVSKLLGHKDISATKKYAHVRDSKKAAAVQGLPKLDMQSQPQAAA